MKAVFEFEFDPKIWEEYLDINEELFIEDLFESLNKDGIESITLISRE